MRRLARNGNHFSCVSGKRRKTSGSCHLSLRPNRRPLLYIAGVVFTALSSHAAKSGSQADVFECVPSRAAYDHKLFECVAPAGKYYRRRHGLCKGKLKENEIQVENCVAKWVEGRGDVATFTAATAPKSVRLELELGSPFECQYSDYFRASACSAKCGGGVMLFLRRRLITPPFDVPSRNCDQETVKYEICHTQTCDRQCVLSDWTSMGHCSTTCGDGIVVNRRRILLQPRGDAENCPHVADPRRVQYRKCNLGRCPEVLGREPTIIKKVVGDCSDLCGIGVEDVLSILEYTTSNIEAEKLKPCTTLRPCENFMVIFAPDKPEMGKWTEVAVLFDLEFDADNMYLILPVGFSVHSKANPGGCPLRKHNIPGIKSCRIKDHRADGRNTLSFKFQALEHSVLAPQSNPLEKQKQMYWFRFWVVLPEKCGETGTNCFDEHQRHWELHIFHNDNRQTSVLKTEVDVNKKDESKKKDK